MKTLTSATIFIIMFSLFSSYCQEEKSKDRFTVLRNEMVDNQIKSRGVGDRNVLKAMRSVERHKFVPNEFMTQAYFDQPLRIGYDQTISQPYIVAYMSEILKPDSTMKVLEIGTGSGYQAAVLAEICDSVYSIEVVPELGEQSAKLLDTLGYKNVKVKVGDGYKGWYEHAPFDAIIVTCAPSHVPDSLKNQLREGGRMIIPVGGAYIQNLVLLKKESGKLKEKEVLSVRFVPMLNKHKKRY